MIGSKNKLSGFTTLLLEFWSYIGLNRRLQFLGLMFLMLMASFSELISIGSLLPFLSALTAPESILNNDFLKPVIHYFNINNSRDLLLVLTIVFAAAAFIAGCLRLILLRTQFLLVAAIGADISFGMYQRALYQTYSFHTMHNSSELISVISGKADHAVNSVIMPAVNIISGCFIISSILIALLWIEPRIAIVAFLGFASIYVCVVFVSRRRLSEDGIVVARSRTKAVRLIQEGLGGIRDILLDGTQKTFCNLYRESDVPAREAAANILFIGSSPRHAIEALGLVFISGLAFTITSEDKGLSNAIPTLGTLALGAQRLLPLLQQVYANLTSMMGGKEVLVESLWLLKQKLPESLNHQSEIPIEFKESIFMENVSFKYEKSKNITLSNISLKINKNSCVGFVGKTGGGKSTLIDLIMGLLEPSSGRLLIDGVEINESNNRGWQLHIAHVPQSIFLADSTIAENIAFGVPRDEIDYEKVYQAARRAQISETIENLENSYLTFVGERGIRLSGGQRQRIGIARALYKRADVIILDEATSALDHETESAVMQSIIDLRENITILIIAHRISTLSACDRIIELEDGRIVKEGSYLEIINKAQNLNKI